jgi:glycosyltransferase involved in cell wall biosynthesis
MLRTLFPWDCNDEWTSHVPFALTRFLAPTDLRAELWVRTRGPRARAEFVRSVLPDSMSPLVALATRINRRIQPRNRAAFATETPADLVTRILEARYVRALRQGDAAHVFRGCSPRTLRAIKARGAVIVLEMSNTMGHTVTRILEDAYRRADWPVEHDKSPREMQAALDLQLKQAEYSDFIFSPSPGVAESLLEVGIPDSKILSTSYGWDPDRFSSGNARTLPGISGVTVLFVGSVCVRKGAHLLLQAWSRAGIDGRLVLLGPIGHRIATHCAHLLNRPDVLCLPFNPDPAPFYRSADMFVLPTLEEGSALATYEAMGVGLPIVTSPMGAGSIVRHEKEGCVVDPHSEEDLIAALRRMAGDADLRRSFGEAGRARALQFTWDKVAARRYDLIRSALSNGFARSSDRVHAKLAS